MKPPGGLVLPGQPEMRAAAVEPARLHVLDVAHDGGGGGHDVPLLYGTHVPSWNLCIMTTCVKKLRGDGPHPAEGAHQVDAGRSGQGVDHCRWCGTNRRGGRRGRGHLAYHGLSLLPEPALLADRRPSGGRDGVDAGRAGARRCGRSGGDRGTSLLDDGRGHRAPAAHDAPALPHRRGGAGAAPPQARPGSRLDLGGARTLEAAPR